MIDALFVIAIPCGLFSPMAIVSGALDATMWRAQLSPQ